MSIRDKMAELGARMRLNELLTQVAEIANEFPAIYRDIIMTIKFPTNRLLDFFDVPKPIESLDDKLNNSVSVLDIDHTIVSKIINAGFTTLAELVVVSEDLLKKKGFAKSDVTKIKVALGKMGLALGMSLPDVKTTAEAYVKDMKQLFKDTREKTKKRSLIRTKKASKKREKKRVVKKTKKVIFKKVAGDKVVVETVKKTAPKKQRISPEGIAKIVAARRARANKERAAKGLPSLDKNRPAPKKNKPATTKKRRRMTDAEKKACSDRMKKYWMQQRATNQTATL